MGRTLRRTGLTDKQKTFAYEYVKDWNATRAAQVAGYKRPKQMGSRLTDGRYYPTIAKFVDRIQEENRKQAILTRNEILQGLCAIAKASPLDMFDPKKGFKIRSPEDIPEHIRPLIQDFKVKYGHDEETGEEYVQYIECKLPAKLSAYDMLLKAIGGYAPEEHKVQHGIDWDSMFNEEAETVEGKIAKVVEEDE